MSPPSAGEFLGGRLPGGALVERAGLRLSRALLRRVEGRPSAEPRDGGLGPHPLGRTADLTSDMLAVDPLLAAVASSHADTLAALEERLAAPLPPSVEAASLELVHLAAAWSLASLPRDRAEGLAGRAHALATWLSAERPLDPRHPDTTLALAAILVAACAWPGLPRARSRRGPVGVALSASLDGLRQGLPGVAPAEVARAAWAACLAHAWLAADHGALPRRARAALGELSGRLAWLAGPSGDLPGDAVPRLLPLGPEPLPHTLARLAVGWGLGGELPCLRPDPACALLLGRQPEGPLAAEVDGRWRLRWWADAGEAAAWRLVRRRPSRAWASGPAGALSWTWDGVLVFESQVEPGSLQGARVDGQQARVVHEGPTGRRVARWQQSRLHLDDTGPGGEGSPRLPPRYAIDGRWELEAREGGWEGRYKGATLVLLVDPDASWELGREGDRTVLRVREVVGPLSLRVELR